MSTNPVSSTKAVVVGAGLMGTGIAHAFATSGYEVVLIDVNADALAKAKSDIATIVEGGIKLGKVDEQKGRAALAGLSTSSDLAGSVQGAAIVVETASEQLAIKHAILREAETGLSDDAIIATNTSALSITEIAAVSRRPSRVIGMHFFNPVHKMKLVEIIRGLETAPETIEQTQKIVAGLGKSYITVNEAPGFTTSRMSAMMGNEAMYMLAEGVASAEDIDTAMRMAFNHPMGPLELGDLTGWDTRLTVLKYLHRVLGEKFRPCPLIEKVVAAGRYGRKSGRGIYEYKDGVRVPGSGIKVA